MQGRIREDDIAAVRERSNIVEIINEYATLKKKGKLFWGLCPFHQEKTPSFKVDQTTQLFHCFGCGEGGNVFTFLMKVEHLEFPEAVELLARRAGYALQYDSSTSSQKSKKDRMFEMHQNTANYYQYILLKTNEGKQGREYLKSRGLEADMVKRFGLGLAPQAWSSLTTNLSKKGFSNSELLDSGLVVKGSKGLYDRFRGRLIFPIHDTQGRVVALGGRIIDKGEPKYLNSPETAIYHKSSLLYGLSLAKNSIIKKNMAIVVEGYTDVIALAQAGIDNVVATLGTAFTNEHIELIKRFTDHVVLVFDADDAGIKAAESAHAYMSSFKLPQIKALQDLERRTSNLDVRVVILPGKQDPAEFIRDHGGEEFEKFIESALPFFDFYLTREIDKYNLSETRQKERAASAGFKLIATLDNPASQKEYLSKIAQRLGLDEDALNVAYNSKYKRYKTVKTEMRTVILDPQDKAERSILQLLMGYPEFRVRTMAEIDESYFQSTNNARIFSVIKNIGKGKFDASTLDKIEPEIIGYISELFLAQAEYEEENLSKYFNDILLTIKDFHYKRQISRLKLELQTLEANGNQEGFDNLFKELIALEARRRDLRLEGSAN